MASIFSRSAIAISCLILAGTAQASVIAYSAADNTGNQNWGGSLGLDFTVNQDIVITELGVFDDDPTGISGTLWVGIYSLDGILQGSLESFTGIDGSLDGSYRFSPVAPISLAAGFEGSVVAWGFNSTDQNGNDNIGTNSPNVSTNDGGGLLSFTDSRWSTSTGWAASWTLATATAECSGDKADCFAAGNFIYQAVPEPGAFSLLFLGLGLTGVARLSRRRETA